MINIRVPEEKDKNEVINLLASEKVDNADLHMQKLDNSMAVFDGNKIIGYSSYVELSKKNTAFIDLLIIKKEYQGQHIGDGLIKSLLNLADNRRIQKVYVIADSESSLFYKKVGLTKRELIACKDIIEYIETDLEDKEVFEAILPDFFNKACKSRC